MFKMPGIPPGYTNVQIFKDPKSKIYAYGYDKKGRKQIIYNKWFIEQQRVKRFKHILSIKASIRAIETHIDTVLGAARPDVLSTDVQICVIIKLMMLCNFRIGNTKYLKDNGSYGLTTLEWSHISFKPDTTNRTKRVACIEFIGKKGVINKSVCDNSSVTSILQRMRKKNSTNTQRVFSVSSRDVNKFIQKFNPDMTTKDIRTWHANYLFIKYFKQAEKDGQSKAKSRVIAVKRVAEELHNTPAVCKKNYLLPEVLGR